MFGPQAVSLEQPKYKVIHAQEGIEFRQYEPHLITETVIVNESDYKKAGKEGFKRLFRYITGNNISQLSIDMTAPVKLEAGGDELTITTASLESGASDSSMVRKDANTSNNTSNNTHYSVSFVLPKRFTLVTAPKPLDPRVKTVQVAGATVAAIRYSGRWSDKNFERYKAKLLTHLSKHGIQTKGAVKSAFYNSPFTLPILRRNEVMVVVTDLTTHHNPEDKLFVSRF